MNNGRFSRHEEYDRDEALGILREVLSDHFSDQAEIDKYAYQLLPYAWLDFDEADFDPTTRRFRFISRA